MTAASDYNHLVARNVRRYREERALSLGQLARRSGLSKQTLSKVEQGSGNPTVDTLAMIGAALDVSPRRLLTEWGTPVYVDRHVNAEWTETGSGEERLLDQIYGFGYVRTSILRLEKGQEGPAGDVQAPGALLHLFVIRGRLRTGPLRDPVDLGAGDFARFPADVPYRHVCLAPRVLAHVVTTLPQVPQVNPIGASTTNR